MKARAPLRLWLVSFYECWLGVRRRRHEREEFGGTALHRVEFECGCRFAYSIGAALAPAGFLHVSEKSLCPQHASLEVDEWGRIDTGKQVVAEFPSRIAGLPVVSGSLEVDCDLDTCEVRLKTLKLKVRYEGSTEELELVNPDDPERFNVYVEFDSPLTPYLRMRRGEVEEFARRVTYWIE